MKQENDKKIRQSNFELMRIISMISIVMYHSIIYGGPLEKVSPTVYSVLQFIIILGFVHVNSFVLVTGYFQYDKKFKWQKFFSLLGQMWFYKVFFVILFCLLGLSTLSGVELFRELLPFEQSYWFVSRYAILYLLSPFLNILISHLSQKQHRNCLIVLIIAFCFIPFITMDRTIMNNGFNIGNFIVLYLVGAYLKKYPLKDNWHFKRFSHNKTQCILLCSMIFVSLLNFGLFMIGRSLSHANNSFIQYFAEMLVLRIPLYSNPLMVLQSILYFLWFETLQLKNIKINKVATLMFGVYLFHENVFMKQHIYQWTRLDVSIPMTWKQTFARLFFTVVVIMIVGCIFEWLRQKLFEFVRKRKISQKISGKVHHYIENF